MTYKAYCTLVFAALLTACGGASDSSANGADAPSKTAAAPSIALGKTGKAEGVDFTVTAVATPNQVGPTGVGAKAEAGETFVVVSYTIKNTSGQALELMNRPAVTLVDPKGQTYAPDEMAAGMSAAMMDDVSGMASDLNPNVSAKTKTAWKVDKAAFDKATWRMTVATDPALTFALK